MKLKQNNVLTIISFLLLFFTIQIQSQDCPFSNLEVEVTQCDSFYYTIVINMECQENAVEFSMIGPNGDMGFYTCDDLPITVDFDGFQNICAPFGIAVYDINGNCSIATSYEVDCCTDCYLHGFHTYGECDNGYMYSYFIDFKHRNNSDSFGIITVWGTSYHSYDELPLQIESFIGDLLIWDLENPNCTLDHYYEYIPDIILEASIINCTDEQYYLQVTAEAMGDLFILYKDGDNIGVYSSLDNLVLGPYDITEDVVVLTISAANTLNICESTVRLSVEECESFQCDFGVEIGAYRCGDSILVEGIVNPHEGTIIFYYYNIDDPILELSPANQIFVFELPYTTESQGTIILESGNCTQSVTFDIADCNETSCIAQEPCYLNELTFIKHPCQTDGNFYVEVFGASDEVDGNPFTIVGNGHQYGTYKYTDLPLFLGPLCADCETNWEFIVQDYDNPACYQIENFGPVCCEPLECFIDDIVFSEQECISTNVIAVSLNFTFDNMPSDSFNVVTYVDNQEYKWTYHYNQLPVRIPDLITNGNSSQVVYVCDALNETCINTIFLELPDCSDYSCLINGLNYQIVGLGNGTFMFNLDEVYISNPEINSIVRLELNQINVSRDINISELPLELGPFDCVDEDYLNIHVGGGFEFNECAVDIINWMNQCGGNFTEEGDLSQISAYIPIGGDKIMINNNGNTLKVLDIELYNIGGKRIKIFKNINIEQSKTMIQLPDMAEGMYFVQLKSKNSQLPIKFAHQRL